MTPAEVLELPTRRLGRRVLVFDRLDSTSTFAAGLPDDPEHDGVAVLAHEQTAGRGQHGRRWLCPPGSGVLLSLRFQPPPDLRRPALLTAWAAVAVCETIAALAGVQAKIKWPNDVLVRGRKVCGILIEQGRATVVGIGLNVNQPMDSFTAAGLPEGASLATATGSTYDHRAVARHLLGQLDEEYDHLRHGDLGGLEACWKWRLGLLGKWVVAECADGTWAGRLRDVRLDGVELETAQGWKVLAPETVRHLRPA